MFSFEIILSEGTLLGWRQGAEKAVYGPQSAPSQHEAASHQVVS